MTQNVVLSCPCYHKGLIIDAFKAWDCPEGVVPLRESGALILLESWGSARGKKNKAPKKKYLETIVIRQINYLFEISQTTNPCLPKLHVCLNKMAAAEQDRP